MLDRVDILGVNVFVTNPRKACEDILGWIKKKEKSYVCVAPVSTIVDCQKDKKYHDIVNAASLVTPDGMPVVWVAKLKGKRNIQRTCGTELMLEMCALDEGHNLKHYFFGGTEESNKKLIDNLKEKFPAFNIVGSYAPGIRAINQQEEMAVISAINEAKPDILWIGLGSPKQDYWMANHRRMLNVPVMVGVGAAFDFIAGVKKQAPKWMRESGLEWLFRLCCEPKRLWKRYLIGNSIFLWLILAEAIGLNRIKK